MQECYNYRKADFRKSHTKVDKTKLNCQFTGSNEHQASQQLPWCSFDPVNW